MSDVGISAQAKWLSKSVGSRPCLCLCGMEVEIRNYHLMPSYQSRFPGAPFYVLGHNGTRVRMAELRAMQEHKTGSEARHWKGGRFVEPEGYIYVRVGDGYVAEHRLVMERKLGRKLTSDEIVHHVNENKHDNDEANLELTNRPNHALLHDAERVRDCAGRYT